MLHFLSAISSFTMYHFKYVSLKVKDFEMTDTFCNIFIFIFISRLAQKPGGIATAFENKMKIQQNEVKG